MLQPIRDVTVGDLLTHLSQALPAHPALLYPQRRWSFSELEKDCVHLSRCLLALGLKPGDRVAVWMSNRPEWLLLIFALAKIGVILVTVNTALQASELGYLLRQSGSRALFTIPGFRDRDYLQTLRQAGSIPTLERVIVVDGDRSGEWLSWARLWEMSKEERVDCQVAVDQIINMQYTSGTTGFPKGVRLSSRNIVNNGYWIGQTLGYSPADRLCLCVPLFHCFGLVIGVMAAYTHGVPLCPVEAFEPLAVLETVERERCTSLYGVPTMFLAELEHPQFSRFDLASLRKGVMAGSLCPELLMRRVISEMHLSEITIAYGLTEASPVVAMTPRFDSLELRTQTVGKVLPELEVRLRDEAGELMVRGYSVMEGYHDDPEATAGALDSQGWLRTGDQASIDDRGYLRITGRIKDTIIRGGENIAPREVEDVLRNHPAVLDVAVYAVTCSHFGEQVAASIRARQTVGAEELRLHCREFLAHYKAPRFIRFVDEFPVTASGKIQKFRLRERHETEIAEST